MRLGSLTRLLVCALAIALLATAVAAAAPPEDAHEPFFPHAGDRRIDVREYHVHLAYSGDGTIRAVAGLKIQARAKLNRFSLDLDGLDVSRVDLGGGGAEFNRRPGKLVIRPLQPIQKGERFTLAVFYSGRPRTIVDEDGSSEGWYPTADGALAVGEPEGTAAWLPCNNIPADKARFRAELVVPAGLTAVSNGRLTAVSRGAGRRNFHWTEDSPMSTYLATVDIGRGALVHDTIAGRPAWTFLDPALAARSRRVLAKLPEIINFESGLYGAYPFATAGSIVDDAPGLGYALETQGRPFYPYVPDLTTVVHETAHQWFGDSVGLKRWPDIWLNEGFATWTEWYYAERHGGRSAAAIFRKLYRVPASDTAFWNPPSARPGLPKHMFGTSVYVRGAMALQALREKVGTKAMLSTLRQWATTHRHASGSTGEFLDLAEAVSGQNLGAFFHRWLFAPGKP